MFRIWPFQEKELFLLYTAPRIDMFEKKDNLAGITNERIGQLKAEKSISEKHNESLGMKNKNTVRTETRMDNDMGGQFLRIMPENILEHTKLGEKLFRRM